ncbi:hypothetical protein JCM14469_06800 [Desulfatiferula olefinivorans]
MNEPRPCEFMETCRFFIDEMTIESIAVRFRQRYCLSCKEACAVYMVRSALGEAATPPRLYPNEYDRALDLLSSKPV